MVEIDVLSQSAQPIPSEISHDKEAPQSVTVDKHYKPRPPSTSLATHLYVAPPNKAGMERRAVLGMSGRGRGNVVWQATSGQSLYPLVPSALAAVAVQGARPLCISSNNQFYIVSCLQGSLLTAVDVLWW